MSQKPNLFSIATKELSQDAVITWLLQWANPQVKDLDAVMHECGSAFLKLLVGAEPHFSKSVLKAVDAGRQWEGIDIWAELYFEDDSRLLLIIEDKVFTGEHSGQLERYKSIAEAWCTKEGFGLSCVYLKVGSETRKLLDNVRSKGFRTFDRGQLIDCLLPFKSSHHQTLVDFIEYLQKLQADHENFQHLPPGKWQGLSWVGFYQFLEASRPVNMWHRVNNQSGGFWNLSLNWDYWGEFPVYIQIEERKICFKIALSEDETGLKLTAANQSAVQDAVQKWVLDFARSRDENRIQRPYPYVHRGAYRTIAVVHQENWLGPNDALINKEQVLLCLNEITNLYEDLMAELKKVSYEQAGIAVPIYTE